MQSGIYVGISAQVALERQLNTLAHNVANSGTTGFRAEEIHFKEVLSETATQSVGFVSIGESYISRNSGPIARTDNPLDVAVKGNSWLGFETPQGPVYTRDGRMTVNAAGDLTTINGFPILDVGGAPLKVNPKGGPISISNDGMISQGGRKLGAIGLFKIADTAKLTRFENSGVIPDQPAEPELDFKANGIRQGYVEKSNVNPLTEMIQLIEISRAFEAITTGISNGQSTLKEAIRTLGESR